MIEEIRKTFDEIYDRREEIIRKGRDLLKEATRAIVETINERFEKAEEHLKNARKIKEEIEKILDEKVKPFVQGFLTIIFQEYVEAEQIYSLIKEKKIKDFRELKVEEYIWILGTFDAIGELSRKIYDLLLKGREEEAKFYIDFIEKFYDEAADLSVYKFIEGLRQRIDWTRKKIEEFKRILLEIKLE